MPRHRRHRHKKPGSPHHEPEQSCEPPTQSEAKYYIVKQSESLGRYLEASRDIAEGTVIIEAEPLVVGPVSDSAPLCLGCYTELSSIDSAEKCKSCKWPLCSNTCKGLNKINGHSKEECSLLSKCPIESNSLQKQQLYNAIFPLRCLMLREHQPEKWRILNTMQAHNELRRKQQSIWNYNQKSVVDRIRNEWKIDKFTEEEIHTVCGYAEVNAFSIGGDSINIQGLYPEAYFFAHDCVANTSHTDDENYKIKVFTSVKLRQGQMLTLSYTNSLKGTVKRREHLRKCKFFECSCQRCSDSTELGTYMSALKCRNCSAGRVLPVEPLRDDTDWRCDACNSIHLNKDINTAINRVEQEISGLDQEKVLLIEAAIRRYSGLLHPSHYLIVGLKYSLSQLYGKTAGFLISQMNEETLQRKVQICEDILKIFDIVEPGFTRIRAITMYELHAPLMILTIKQSERGHISHTDLARNLKRVAFYLRECVRLLKFESKGTQEDSIRTAAVEGLVQLKSWEPAVGKL
ncbi:SET domain-containing protein SmydA-8-like [Macrosteles quadrilineatus]|uniref:SET domain-containing protein SmydA-8-like n=1 Tax=Macrosteles quadrilineatus TaxID=74068 RepID=UPI0023E1CADA|nr:SET domain-containing protein SmydA-8-like [Macrosteles quadrilineatus]